jgi:hypothetical protein
MAELYQPAGCTEYPQAASQEAGDGWHYPDQQNHSKIRVLETSVSLPR